MGRRKKNRAALKKKRKRVARRLREKQAVAEVEAAGLAFITMPEEIIWLIVEQLTYRYDAVNLGRACARLAEVVFCRGGSPASQNWARKKLGQLRKPYCTVYGGWYGEKIAPLQGGPISGGAVIFIVRRHRELIARGCLSPEEPTWSPGDWKKYWPLITPGAAEWLLSRDLGPWKVGEAVMCMDLSFSACFSRLGRSRNLQVWNLLKSRLRKVIPKDKDKDWMKAWAAGRCKSTKIEKEVCRCKTYWRFKGSRFSPVVPFPEIEPAPPQISLVPIDNSSYSS
jgi:hypothetical protein